MLGWALTFLVIALIAAVFGFGGVAGTAAGIAKIFVLRFPRPFHHCLDHRSHSGPRGLNPVAHFKY